MTPQSLKEKIHIAPKQYIEFKSLTGDVSDNIKGVPNIGPVRAAKIINRQLKFDLRPYAAHLTLNHQLIALNDKISVCSNWHALGLSSQVLSLKNNELFHRLQF